MEISRKLCSRVTWTTVQSSKIFPAVRLGYAFSVISTVDYFLAIVGDILQKHERSRGHYSIVCMHVCTGMQEGLHVNVTCTLENTALHHCDRIRMYM